MASSAVSSVMGSPLREGSCFGFLSFAAAGIAASAGKSTPSEKMQAKESATARIDLGVAQIAGSFRKKSEAGRAGGPITLSWSMAEFAGGRGPFDTTHLRQKNGGTRGSR